MHPPPAPTDKENEMTPREILTAGPVVPVIAIDDPQTAVGLAQALLDGGIRVLEITLRTPAVPWRNTVKASTSRRHTNAGSSFHAVRTIRTGFQTALPTHRKE